MSIRQLVRVVFCVFACAPAARGQQTITVSAGEFDRRQCIVQFKLPEDTAPGLYTLLNPDYSPSLQVGPAGRATFILPRLKAGQSVTYRLREAGPLARSKTSIIAVREGDRVAFNIEGRHILHYQGGKTELPAGYEPAYQRGGYIHPLYTPFGKLVTDDYPPKHKHHHGVWSPWTKTEFEGRHPDFWNMGEKTGTVEFVSIDAEWSGDVVGGVAARHRMVDLSAKPQPKPVLDEVWNVRVYNFIAVAGGAAHVFDWTSTQTCASDSPLVLPKYHYGGFGVRGNRQWEDKSNCFFLTSEGKDRSNGNETTGKWCWMGGKVDDRMAGVIILCHPDNFRFPQGMRLNPDEPFFCYCPSQAGEWKIEPGKPYVAKYRVIAADGPADAKEIERLWNDYANPPKVAIE